MRDPGARTGLPSLRLPHHRPWRGARRHHLLLRPFAPSRKASKAYATAIRGQTQTLSARSGLSWALDFVLLRYSKSAAVLHGRARNVAMETCMLRAILGSPVCPIANVSVVVPSKSGGVTIDSRQRLTRGNGRGDLLDGRWHSPWGFAIRNFFFVSP